MYICVYAASNNEITVFNFILSLASLRFSPI